MKIPVTEKIFRNEDIYLDGHSWKRCLFYNCNIIIERGEYDLIECEFHSCRLTLRGNAIAIAKVLKLFYPDMPIWFSNEETKQQVLERMKEKLKQEGMLK